jgi:hypothetical protein
LVLIKNEQKKYKLDSLWEGPFEVKRVEYPNLIIQRVGKRKRERLHMNRAKMFCLQEEQDVASSWDLE